jgi:putative ABC transport system permease protein
LIRSFDALAIRQMRTRKLRALLTAFGIVLGVGMVFGVLLLVGTIRHTFDQLIDSAWGKTDVVVLGNANGAMPQRTVARIRAVPGVRDAGGMVGSVFTRLDQSGKAIKGRKGSMWVAGFNAKHSPYDFKTIAGHMPASGANVMLEKNWARNRSLWMGDYVTVATPTGRARLHIVGIFGFSGDLSFGDQGFAAMPVAEVRRLGDVPTGWHQIAVKATDRSRAGELRQRIATALGPGFEVKTPRALGDEIGRQLQALNVILYFFSGIALFVGGFLILNSFNMTVLQRIREIGMLRTLGASRRMVARTVLIEALAIGALGTVLGLGLGLALSLGLISLMKGIGVPIGNLYVTPVPAGAAVLMGLLATAVGALWPARRAARVAPVRAALGAMEVRRRTPFRRAAIGVALFLPGLLFGGSFWFGNQAGSGPLAAIGGIGGTMLMFFGLALAAPFIITPVVRALALPLRRLFPTGGRLAGDAAGSNPARTAATAVSLTIGLSVIVVNAAMSASFLGTISDQVDRTYARDFTLEYSGLPIEQGGGPIAPRVRRDIAAMPEAGVVSPVRVLVFKLPKAPGSTPGMAMGVDPATFGKVDLTPLEGSARPDALRGLASGGVIVSRAYADAAHLHVDSILPLRGATRTQPARVVGILKAITGQSLVMQMSIHQLRELYGATVDNQLLVKARPGASRAALGHRIDTYLERRHPNLESLSVAEVKDQIKTQINQQFNLFNAIIAIAVIVSLLGVINTLAMSVMERTREIGVLRALGASRWLVRSTMLDESLLITVAGALAGIAFGALIAFVWISDLDSLLPGISFHFPVGATIAVALAAVVLGALAAVLPARRAARLKPVEALSYE